MVELVPLAKEICRRYRDEFPDEAERYGDAGIAWCVHDNQHLLFWGAGAVDGWVDLDRQVDWLATVLETRGFPLDRLARNLDLGAEVILQHLEGDHGHRMAAALTASATSVRLRASSASS
ncbi:hypothetical protein [Nocardioides sp.]|uniref:hypothetical protein n=1 Tax=Nocardioides sp. TaxID=35761 RepID=UPI002BA3674E|nr:hypothetical protein [Nocardioides sp.]HXH81203.1 hypothetical protein [Nocardioides sp.]